MDRFYEGGQLVDPYVALREFLPGRIFDSVRQILYGPYAPEIALRAETAERAGTLGVEVKHFRIGCEEEQLRPRRTVRVGAIQNRVVLETSRPVQEQKRAIMARIAQIAELAALEGVNVLCLQEIWTAPFFMCTRERYPWVEFAEPIDGESTQMLRELAKRHNMVIVSSILERERVKETLHNSAVVIDNHGAILGKQEKGHIPRVGDFNESTYYMEGETGHPVFETEFGKIGVNICYGRHHPLHWMGFGLNGAEIVFNPSATVNGLSEPLWGIEARNAAIANHYFAVGINRVGTEVYPNEFTSGDRRQAHRDFGHFYGSSYVAAPDGSRTPSLARTRDGLLVTELDLNLCRQVKDKWGFAMTGRHALYADLLARYSQLAFEPQLVNATKPQK